MTAAKGQERGGPVPVPRAGRGQRTRGCLACISRFRSLSGTEVRTRGTIAPGLCVSQRPRKHREGAGKAGCPPHPVRKKSTGKEPQVKAESSGLPCAMVLRFIRALPGDRPGTGLVCPRRAQAAHRASRVLGASVGAPGPHDFTVRKRLGRRAQRLRPKLSRPSHPASRFVTTAKRPSCRSGPGEISHISEKRKMRIFFAAGLDTGINVESAREIRCFTHAIFAP